MSLYGLFSPLLLPSHLGFTHTVPSHALLETHHFLGTESWSLKYVKLNHRGIRNLLKTEWLKQPNDTFFTICTVKKTLKKSQELLCYSSCPPFWPLLPFSISLPHDTHPLLPGQLYTFTSTVAHAFINADLTISRDLGIQ